MAHTPRETSHTAQVVDLFGGADVLGKIVQRVQLREALRHGLPYSALEALMRKLGLDRTEVLRVLSLNPRTLARRKKESALRPDESDRLYRLARIVAAAQDVLGTLESAARWLAQPNRALGHEAPLTLLDTDIGTRQVEAVLGRIDAGVFS